MDASLLWVPLIMGLGVFAQSVSGFGIALVAMPLLVPLAGLRIAAPLVIVVAVITNLSLIIHYRSTLQFKGVWRLVLASAAGIPVGLLVLEGVQPALVERLLGVLLFAYALYLLAAPKPRTLAHPAWGYGLGFVGGLLAGAYNVGGPPAVIYANGQGWPPALFKANLQAYAMVNGPLVMAGHAVAGNYSTDVLALLLLCLPVTVVAVLAGVALDGRLNPLRFRRIVAGLLLLLSLRLIA